MKKCSRRYSVGPNAISRSPALTRWLESSSLSPSASTTSAAPAGAADVVEADGLRLDDSSHRVSAGEREIALGPTEYRLLHFFMTHPERVFSRGQLLDRVWGGNTYVEERTVDVHIRRLRKALEPFLLERFVQ